MDDIVIKKVDNGYVITQGSKVYISTKSLKIFWQILNKILKKEVETPPPLQKLTAKKVALNEG
jgi:hypothetical protein